MKVVNGSCPLACIVIIFVFEKRMIGQERL
jgi:hypothetical protein